VQHSWSPDVVLRIGIHLVHAHAKAGHADRAIGLCDTLYYNVRQSRGGLDPSALELAELLTTLYKRAGRVREAGRVHAEVVRDLDEQHWDEKRRRDHGDRLRATANFHLEGMRQCGWQAGAHTHSSADGGASAASNLYDRLVKRYGQLSVPSVSQWGANGGAKPDEAKLRETSFSDPEDWGIGAAAGTKGSGSGAAKSETGAAVAKRDDISSAKERWGQWRSLFTSASA
jgi:hypothetical protein